MRASQKESDAERVTQRLEAINAVCVVLNKFLSTEMARAREEFERTQTISQEKYEEVGFCLKSFPSPDRDDNR